MAPAVLVAYSRPIVHASPRVVVASRERRGRRARASGSVAPISAVGTSRDDKGERRARRRRQWRLRGSTTWARGGVDVLEHAKRPRREQARSAPTPSSTRP